MGMRLFKFSKKEKELAEKGKEILETGQESDTKAKEAVIKLVKEGELKEELKKAKEKELVFEARQGKIVNYHMLLSQLLDKRMAQVDFPDGWRYKTGWTAMGVILELYSPSGRKFRAGFKPTGIPLYDLNAVDTYAIRAENTIDRITKADGTSGKIILPK